MTLYTQALTYAINNIDNLCYYFETEIEKHLEKNKNFKGLKKKLNQILNSLDLPENFFS